MKDFTLKAYTDLLQALISCGYNCTSYLNYLEKNLQGKPGGNQDSRVAILRHDVDKLPLNSQAFAKIQNALEITGTYYFRVVKESFDAGIIKEIAALGHEIGYHYEDMDFANGDKDKAIKLFEEHLSKIRNVAEVKTICMHGSPLSKWDNKDVWKKYDYHNYGIIAEPYFDINFNEFYYLTDTGRSWNASGVSVRDKVNSKFSFPVKTTSDIIDHLKKNKLPDKIMFNFHPQRWTNDYLSWIKELFLQNSKNIVKSIIIKRS